MHVLYLIATAIGGLVILGLSEYIGRRGWLASGEKVRKLAHILIGMFAASWPFYLHMYEIQLISLALIAGVLTSVKQGWFSQSRTITRRTYGELFFAAAIGVTTMLSADAMIYAVAMLHLSLADGLAALVGVRWGKPYRYEALGALKSLPGTFTFFAVSIVLIFGYSQLAGVFVPLALMAGVSLGAALLENIGNWGIDNILVPSFVACMLTLGSLL